MFPNGTIYNIYHQKFSGLHGEVRLHATRLQKTIYTFARGLGAGLIGFVVITIIFTFSPLIKEEITFRFYKPSELDLISAQNVSDLQEEARGFGVNSYFSVVIPKINAKANIIANVDASSETEYTKALKEGVAHAKGTYFPGQGKNIFLFAHSTNQAFTVARYNAVFYLLDKMEVGDEVIVYFADQRYIYKVSQTKIVAPDDISSITQTYDEETLILQTCYPPGTSWNRLLLLAKRL